MHAIPGTATPRILIVDDQPVMRAVIVAALTPLGYDLHEAADGAAALAMAVSVDPDVVLLDVRMPGLNGLEVTRRLRENPVTREVPVIIVTSLDDRESRAAALAAGADEILAKPIDGIELRLRVQTICRLNRYRLLVQQRRNLAALLEGASVGTMVCSPDGTPLYANETARRVFALDDHLGDESATGPRSLRVELRERIIGAAGAAFAGGAPVQVAAAEVPSTAGTYEMMVSATMWEGLSAIRVDLLEQRRSVEFERHLRHRERLASLGQLSAGIAHEVASVLSIIDLAAQMPEAVTGGADAARGQIRAAVARGARLVRQLLRSARPSLAPRRGVTLRIVRDELVPEVVALLFDAVTVTVDGDAAAELPLDRDETAQVLLNLISNARDAGATAVEVTLARSEERVQLVVRDNGRGLDPRIAARIGTPFVSGREEAGHGLGVWTVRRILEDLGGALRYESEPAGGTCAICDVPTLAPLSGDAIATATAVTA